MRIDLAIPTTNARRCSSHTNHRDKGEDMSDVSPASLINPIRLFSYLDQYKLYSISSQVFEGLTEYVLQSSTHEQASSSEKNEPSDPGKVVGDIMRVEHSHEEKRYMHDHSYSVVERQLIETGRVVSFSSVEELVEAGPLTGRFVKVIGRAKFYDAKALVEAVLAFNDLTAAVGYVSSQEQRQSLEASYEQRFQDAKTKQDRDAIRKEKEVLSNPMKLAELRGSTQDPKFLEQIAYVLQYGYADRFEVRVELDGMSGTPRVFSAVLDRRHFTESEDILLQRVGRAPEVPFTLLGVVTRVADIHEGISATQEKEPIATSPASMKEALLHVVDHFANVDQSIVGQLSNEYVIDPIALYREL